jgi:hypothetical protein
MVSVLKVRRAQKAGDYSNPGWFKHPAGTVASEYGGELATPARMQSPGVGTMPAMNMPKQDVEVQVRKPIGHSGH